MLIIIIMFSEGVFVNVLHGAVGMEDEMSVTVDRKTARTAMP